MATETQPVRHVGFHRIHSLLLHLVHFVHALHDERLLKLHIVSSTVCPSLGWGF